MTVAGILRGHRCAVGLTDRERRVFDRALTIGFLIAGRIGMVDHAWEIICGTHRHPCLIVRPGRSTASITLDLGPAHAEMDERMQQAIRIRFFRAGSKAPNAAARGRLRRVIITPAYAYARVPLAWAEATAEALLAAVCEQTKPGSGAAYRGRHVNAARRAIHD